MNHHVRILSGVSGSGKSTLAAKYATTAEVISADDYFMKAGKYSFEARFLGEAHAACLRRFISAMQSGLHAIVDNTNTTIAEIAPYYAVARAYEATVELVTVACDPAIAHARNKHDVPLSTIVGQHSRIMTRQIPPFWEITQRTLEGAAQ